MNSLGAKSAHPLTRLDVSNDGRISTTGGFRVQRLYKEQCLYTCRQDHDAKDIAKKSRPEEVTPQSPGAPVLGSLGVSFRCIPNLEQSYAKPFLPEVSQPKP